MTRTPLLLEALAKRYEVRTGLAYVQKTPAGVPRHPRLEHIFYQALRRFDLGPLLTGDLSQARLMAEDLYQHLQESARKGGIARKEVAKHLRKLGMPIRSALSAFATELFRRAIRDT